MRAADIFCSPGTQERFSLTAAEAMAAGCTVITADHSDSAAEEVIDDAGFLPAPTVDALTNTLDRVLTGERPPTDPVERARQYNWDAVAKQAERTYQAAIDDTW